MPVMIRENTVAAGTAVANVFTGSAFEYVRSNAILSLGAKADEVGLLGLVNVGADVVMEESPIPFIVRTSTPEPVSPNAYPIIPDDFYAQDAAAAGDRIVLALRNPTAGSIICYSVCIITYVR